MKILIFMVLLVFGVSAEAATNCTTLEWKSDRSLPLDQIKPKLDAISRIDIVRMAWWEILNDPKPSMAGPMLHYLSGTEPQKIRRGYYKAMHAMITSGQTPEEAIKIWPKRPKQNKSIYSLNELCSLYERSVEK